MRDRLLDAVATGERGVVVVERAVGAAEDCGKAAAEGGQEGGHAAAHYGHVALDDAVCCYHDVVVWYSVSWGGCR